MSWASAAMRYAGRTSWEEALAVLREQLGGVPPDLCCLFVAGGGDEAAPDGEGLLASVCETLDPGEVVGCSASGVLGAGSEIETGPAVAVLAGHLDGATLRGVHVDPEALRDGVFPTLGTTASALVFADPWTCDGDALLAALRRAGGERPVVGGLASGAPRDGGATLFAGRSERRGGCALVSVDGGGWTLDTVVAQGCRPIGQPLFVTEAEGEWLIELDGRPALRVLRDLAESAPEKDRALLARSLFLGIEMHPQRDHYGRGDFLIRNLVGADPERGAIALAARPQPGQVVQFHLRDAEASADDLDSRLRRYRRDTEGDPEAALLCSCVGRGEQLYGRPDHDSHAFLRAVGGLPLGGFFCNGEIGPVGGRPFLHAYTSAFGMLRRVVDPTGG